jgi:hypothetical protein
MVLELLVPTGEAVSLPGIAPRSAIVGRKARALLMIDFEGGIYGGSNDFEERLQSAAGRAKTNYPTGWRSIG